MFRCLLVTALFTSLSFAAEKPNVLFIIVDDLRPMLGCYGDPRAITPSIDELAAESVRFDRAYCNYAKCGPSRLSMSTGLRPATIGVYSNDEDEITAFRSERSDAIPMPRWFLQNGYTTSSFGKFDHDGAQQLADWSEPPYAGRDREMWEVMPEDGTSATIIADRTACPAIQSPDVADDHLFAGRMTNEVIARLKEENGETPFFYAVGFRRPHLPFVAPQKYFDLHEPDASWLEPNQLPPARAPSLAWYNSDGYTGMATKLGYKMPARPDREKGILFNGFEMRSYEGVTRQGEFGREEQLDLIHAYSACISYVDAQIGKIMTTLKEENLRENTVIVFVSDHGWHLGEQSAWGKMTNYEIANRIPLLISAPAMAPGATAAFAELVDLYPTLCELAAIPTPAHAEGESLTSILQDPAADGREAVRHEYERLNGRFHGRAIRTKQYRYIQWTDRNGKFEAEELYELVSDPDETSNIASDTPEIVEELRSRLRPL